MFRMSGEEEWGLTWVFRMSGEEGEGEINGVRSNSREPSRNPWNAFFQFLIESFWSHLGAML